WAGICLYDTYQHPDLTAVVLSFIDGQLLEWCGLATVFQCTLDLADMPPELCVYLKEHRFFAMFIKKEDGGLELSAYAQSRV
ncbi:hypothetical protein, partial [Salmonella enterica]|uniref:hypothetical protein n=1 Tax=Salmonella enterica TaxID=28901 RepID=UPI00288CDF73